MKNLMLHVGFGKTGSSYIQSALALNRENLEKSGIFYPNHPKLTAASQGAISGGNISPVDLIERVDRAFEETSCSTVLYSNEGLFGDIQKNKGKYLELSKRFNLHVILYLRDPLSHAISCYQQTIKRGGSTLSIGEYITDVYKHPALLEDVLSFLRENDIKVTTLNYSRRKKQLLESFYSAIELECVSHFLPPVKGRINRSLTNSEMAIQRLFNLYIGQASSRFISDPLCEELSDIDSETPYFSRKEYNEFVDRVRSSIETVNRMLNSDDVMMIESYPYTQEKVSDDSVSFSYEQLNVIVGGVSSRLKLLEELKSYVDSFRDLALKLEKDESYSIEHSRTLMKAANLLRPDGPFIKKKLQEYSDLINKN